MKSTTFIRKVTSIILLISVSTMTLSCTSYQTVNSELNINRISYESKRAEQNFRIDRSVLAQMKDGSAIMYKMEMKVVRDTIVSEGIRFSAIQSQRDTVVKVPLIEVEKFEYADGKRGLLPEEKFLWWALLVIAVGVHMIGSALPKNLPI